MLIFLYGQDDYRRKEREKFYLSEFKKKHSHLGVGKFDLAEESEFEKFKIFVRSESLFEPLRLVLLDHCGEVADEAQKDLIRELKSLAEHKEATVVLSFAKKPVAAFTALVKKAFNTEEFETLSGYEWEKFVRAEAKRWDVKLTEDAVRFLCEAYQGDTWRLVTELQKLSPVDRSVIDKAQLEALDIEIAPDFWELLNGLKSYAMRDRVVTLERILSAGEPAGKIFNIAAYQLPGKLREMAHYDALVKSGKMDYEEALLDLAIS